MSGAKVGAVEEILTMDLHSYVTLACVEWLRYLIAPSILSYDKSADLVQSALRILNDKKALNKMGIIH